MSHLLSRSLKVLEVLLMLIMVALVFSVLFGVFGRFVLQAAPRWTEELATFLLAWLSLLGAVVAYARNEHLGVDLLVYKLDLQNQRLCELMVQSLIAFFCAFVFVFGGGILLIETLRSGQLTPAMGIRMGLVYSVVPISGVLFVMVAWGKARVIWQRGGSDETMADQDASDNGRERRWIHNS